jgi:hypothetical protein
MKYSIHSLSWDVFYSSHHNTIVPLEQERSALRDLSFLYIRSVPTHNLNGEEVIA